MAVFHLFYRINHGVWQEFSPTERKLARGKLEGLVEEAREWPGFRVHTFSMLARADIGFMVLGEDVAQVDRFEKRLARVLGPDVLFPEYSFLSLTERSEYTPGEAEFTKNIEAEEGLKPGTPEFEERVKAIRERMDKYVQNRLYPHMPQDWEYFCFYPMRKRREPQQNWYALDFETRKKLMAGHARVGRTYADRVRQLVTGCTGLDDWEWGVSLFAHNPSAIKDIVYEMRFDEVTHTYAEFGHFYNGLQLPVDTILTRLGM